MLQTVFSKDDNNDLSHSTCSYNVTVTFLSSNGGVYVPLIASGWTFVTALTNRLCGF